MLILPGCKRLAQRLALDIHYNTTFWLPNQHCRRKASTTSAGSNSESRFPYPQHRSPTPHQIFHLPHSATESDIKARYFDLVRIYHPDKAGVAVSPDVAHARFRAITAAYDTLRGKTPSASADNGFTASAQDRSYQTTAAWRAARQRRQELYTSGAVDDSWKDGIILGGAVLTVVIVMIQLSNMRREGVVEMISSRARQSVVYHNKPPSQDKRLDANSDHGSEEPDA